MIAGKHILVVEDEFLIGAMIVDFLEDFGGLPIGPIPTVGEALIVIDQRSIDLAVIDWNLRGEAGAPIGSALLERGIPFVISTGYGVVEEAFAAITVLTKPYGQNVLIAELSRLVTAQM